MTQDPVPGPGQDGEPVPPGAVTPDWVTDEDWDRMCASRTGDDEPDGFGEDWDAWDPDPEDGPPPDWAALDVAQLAAQARADGAEHEAVMRRLLAAGAGDGYAHQRGEPPAPGSASGPAAGFGQGRCLDAAAPCTTLSQLADDACGEDRDFAGVSDDELLGVLSARARLEARQAWERLMAVAEFIRRRPEAGCPLEGPGRMPRVWQLTAVGELRAQLHLSPGEASALLDLAHDLAAKLPVTSAALRDGVIDLRRAQWVSWRCAVLTVAEARAAEELVFGDPDVAEWSFGVFRDRVARAVILVNPEAAVKRREESARDRRVEVRAELSGNAALVGRELPPSAVLAASQVLTARARELRRAGLAGGMDELRVLAYLEKLGVLDPFGGAQADGGPGGGPGGGAGQEADAAAGGHLDAGPGESLDVGPGKSLDIGPGESLDAGPGEDPDAGSGGGNGGNGRRGPAGPGPGGGAAVPPGALAAKANLTLPLATLLGLADRPGTLPRLGPIDPALVRDLAAAAARHPATTWCLTITDADGRPVAHGCGRPPPRTSRRPRTLPGPGRRLKDAPPGSPARDGPARHAPADNPGPPGGPGAIRLSTALFTGQGRDSGQELVFALHPLAGPCDHRHQANGHDPGVLLRHLTGILNANCTFPPCRRPDNGCDYEHSRPHHQGGKTCLCDAGPVCRHDHQAKQSPGWHLEQAGARGWFRWTTPSGRSYINGPTQYPA